MKAQGDVLMVETTGISQNWLKPHTLEKDEKGRLVLHQGEKAGHAHCLVDGEVETFKTQANVFGTEEIVVQPKKDTQLTHPEHAPIDLQAGVMYRVKPQKQFQDSTKPVFAHD